MLMFGNEPADQQLFALNRGNHRKDNEVKEYMKTVIMWLVGEVEVRKQFAL